MSGDCNTILVKTTTCLSGKSIKKSQIILIIDYLWLLLTQKTVIRLGHLHLYAYSQGLPLFLDIGYDEQ